MIKNIILILILLFTSYKYYIKQDKYILNNYEHNIAYINSSNESPTKTNEMFNDKQNEFSNAKTNSKSIGSDSNSNSYSKGSDSNSNSNSNSKSKNSPLPSSNSKQHSKSKQNLKPKPKQSKKSQIDSTKYTDKESSSNTDYPTNAMLDSSYSQLQSGYYHTCTISSSTLLVHCWGSNIHGQIDIGRVPKANSVAAGGMHTCMTTNNDLHLICWGYNKQKQTTVPETLKFATLAFSLGKDHTCGITYESKILCFGSNTNGQSDVPDLNDFREVSAGGVHSCGIMFDGIFNCWGSGMWGQTKFDMLESMFMIDVEASLKNTCFIYSDNITEEYYSKKLICIGDNSEGQCNTHKMFGLIEQYVHMVSVGPMNTCYIENKIGSKAELVCVGSDSENIVSGSESYREMNKSYRTKYVAVGMWHACVEFNQQIKCWGNNDYGQLNHDG